MFDMEKPRRWRRKRWVAFLIWFFRKHRKNRQKLLTEE